MLFQADKDPKNCQKSYFVIVIALSIIITSSFFIEQSFAQTATTPDQPIGLTATAVSPTSINLNWSPPQNNGGSPITGYRIDYRIAPSSTYTTLATLSNVTAYTHASLITGKTYIYRVYAINAIGTGNPSPEVVATPTSSSTPPKNIVPNPPQNLVASTYSSTQINLSWNPPSNNGGPSVTGYKIDYMLDSGVFTNIVSNSGSTLTTYSHTGLQTGHTYTYRVFAINSVGTSNSSNTAYAIPSQVITVPGPPTLSATSLSSTSISLSWVAPNDGGSPINGYKIEFTNGTSQYTVLVANTGNTQTSYIHKGLTTGASYTYRVTAINSIGPGNPSNVVTAQPQDTKTPTIISAVAISPTSVKLSWIQPSQTYGQVISGYKIDQVINGNLLPVDETASSVTSYTVPNLTTGKTYTFSVTALLTGGSQTNPSSPVSVTPTSTSSAPSSSDQSPSQNPTPPQNQALPDSPAGVNATLISVNTVQISWIAPSNNGKLPITGYKIESKTGTSGTWYTITSNTGVQTSFIKSGLQAGTTYFYRVSSISSIGTSQPSSQVSISVPQAPNQTPQSPPPSQHSQGMIPVFNTTSTISYEITGGQILGIGINPGTFSLNINLKDDNPGTLSVKIPREMMDAKKLDGTDDTYIVTNDKNIAKFNETKTGAYRTLSISFPANTGKVSIYGTTVVPEFPIAPIAFLLAFIPVILLSKRIRK